MVFDFYADISMNKFSATKMDSAAAPGHLPAAAASVPLVRAVTSDIDSPTRRGAARPDDFALVIGIEEYQSVPKADYGVRDALTVRRHLEALGFPPRDRPSKDKGR